MMIHISQMSMDGKVNAVGRVHHSQTSQNGDGISGMDQMSTVVGAALLQ